MSINVYLNLHINSLCDRPYHGEMLTNISDRYRDPIEQKGTISGGWKAFAFPQTIQNKLALTFSTFEFCNGT